MESHSISSLLGDIGIVALLVALGGLFVAAEIALISLRESQIKQIALKGKRGAKVAHLASNPNRLLGAVQIGVTFCGFLSAALGAERLGEYVIPWLEDLGLSTSAARGLSLVGLTIVIAYFSLVFGELVPKRLALSRTEPIALLFAGLIDMTAKLFRPIIWLLSHSNIVEEVFNASERQIHEVMVPRTEVDFFDASLTVGKAISLAIDKAHSRYPVVRGSTDEVIGFIHVRDLLDTTLVSTGGKIQELVRNVMFLPGTKGVLPALTEMRNQRQHLAIVLDEYGGTDGIVTLEDLVECLIGDIRDEYDGDEDEITLETRTGDFEVDGLVSIEDILDDSGIEIPEGPYETASGFVMHFLGRIPVVGDVVKVNGIRIAVLTMEGKRAGRLLISRN